MSKIDDESLSFPPSFCIPHYVVLVCFISTPPHSDQTHSWASVLSTSVRKGMCDIQTRAKVGKNERLKEELIKKYREKNVGQVHCRPREIK